MSQTRTFGDICEFDKHQGMHQGLPYLGLEHIESGTGRFFLSGTNLDAKSSTFRFSDKHILYGRLRPYLKKVALPDRDGRCSTEIFPILPKSGVDRRYLSYWLMSDATTGAINATCTGARMPRANMDEVLDFKLFVPNEQEQQRIVGILDAAFAGIATAKANAENNLENTHAIFDCYLQSVFTQRAAGWVEKVLGEVCIVKDGTHDSPKYVADGIPFVTQKNIRVDGLSFEKTKFISQKDHKDFCRRSDAVHGDILISMIGANRGMACIVDDERPFSIKNVGLVKQNPHVNHQFVLYFLKSPQAASFVRGASKGGAQEFIGLTELRRFPIPLPPLECQKAFAEAFQSLHEEIQRLESLYQRKLDALDALKQSLLHQAFSGQL